MNKRLIVVLLLTLTIGLVAAAVYIGYKLNTTNLETEDSSADDPLGCGCSVTGCGNNCWKWGSCTSQCFDRKEFNVTIWFCPVSTGVQGNSCTCDQNDPGAVKVYNENFVYENEYTLEDDKKDCGKSQLDISTNEGLVTGACFDFGRSCGASPTDTPTPTPTNPGGTNTPTPTNPNRNTPTPTNPNGTNTPTPTSPNGTNTPTPTNPNGTNTPTPTNPNGTNTPTPSCSTCNPTPTPTCSTCNSSTIPTPLATVPPNCGTPCNNGQCDNGLACDTQTNTCVMQTCLNNRSQCGANMCSYLPITALEGSRLNMLVIGIMFTMLGITVYFLNIHTIVAKKFTKLSFKSTQE